MPNHVNPSFLFCREKKNKQTNKQTFNTKIYERKKSYFVACLLFFFYVVFYVYFITYKIPSQHIRINMSVNKM